MPLGEPFESVEHSLVLCFVNTVSVMPSTRRHLARIDDEGAPDSCIEEEDAARGVEGRQNVIEFYGTLH